MAAAAPAPRRDVEELVTTALRQDKLSGLNEMLGAVASVVEGSGCVLWGVVPGEDLQLEPEKKGRLFTQALWFNKAVSWASYDLKPSSVTGRAVIAGQPENVSSVRTHPYIDSDDPFFQETGTQCFCTIPLRFLDGTKGALTVYRDTSRPFSRSEFELIQRMAALVPALHESILNRVGVGLIRDVYRVLHDADLRFIKPESYLAAFKVTSAQICDLVNDAFHIIETSLFLEDALEAPGKLKLVASTYLPFVRTYEYTADQGGITPWIFRERRFVRIFDLANWDRDLPSIRKMYPNITWEDPANVRATVRSLLGKGGDFLLQPLSFMGVPVVAGDRAVGVLRCCTSRQSPYYFLDTQLKLLESVAAQCAHSWLAWQSRREAAEDSIAIERLTREVDELNLAMLEDLASQSLEESNILQRSLSSTERVFPSADVFDIRLRDPDRSELYYAAFHGEIWEKGHPQDVAARKTRRFPIDDLNLVGPRVMREGCAVVHPSPPEDAYFSNTFLRRQCLLAAPIGFSGRCLGVLDIRSPTARALPRNAKTLAELLGRQIGLHLSLASTFRKMSDQQESHLVQTYSDIAHQLKTPIGIALKQASDAVRLHEQGEALDHQLEEVRNSITRVQRVVAGTELFSKLVRTGRLDASLHPVEAAGLAGKIRAVTEEFRRTMNPDRRALLKVLDLGMTLAGPYRVLADPLLVEQAVFNVIDNAAKFSYPEREILITGVVTNQNQWHLVVTNWGIRIGSQETERVFERGWQGREARLVSATGTGTGLYLVRLIMEAHGGTASAMPTEPDGKTVIMLSLPLKE